MAQERSRVEKIYFVLELILILLQKYDFLIYLKVIPAKGIESAWILWNKSIFYLMKPILRNRSIVTLSSR